MRAPTLVALTLCFSPTLSAHHSDIGLGLDTRSRSKAAMISVLDGIRDLLEDLGNGLGVTDPVSGEVVLEL